MLNTSPCGNDTYVIRIDGGFCITSTCTKCFRKHPSLWQIGLYHKMISSITHANWAMFWFNKELKRVHSAPTLLHSTCTNPSISCSHEQLTCEHALVSMYISLRLQMLWRWKTLRQTYTFNNNNCTILDYTPKSHKGVDTEMVFPLKTCWDQCIT
jgi:hypothetical protein